jgi:hypothetical protein
MAFVALSALALVLALNAPGQARPGGHGFGGGPHGGVVHHGFDGHHGFHGHHGFDGHHGFAHHGFHRGFAFGPAFPYYGYYPYGYYPYGYSPYYGYRAPAYLYYCGSLGAYYPGAQSCPEGWVPVPVT